MFEVQAGENIYAYIRRVKNNLIVNGKEKTTVCFGGINLTVYSYSNISVVAENYMMLCKLRSQGFPY